MNIWQVYHHYYLQRPDIGIPHVKIGIISKKQWKVADFYKRKLDSNIGNCIIILTEPTTPLIFMRNPVGLSIMGDYTCWPAYCIQLQGVFHSPERPQLYRKVKARILRAIWFLCSAERPQLQLEWFYHSRYHPRYKLKMDDGRDSHKFKALIVLPNVTVPENDFPTPLLVYISWRIS